MDPAAARPTPENPDPPLDRAAVGALPTRSSRLIGLIRGLITYGKSLVVTLRGQPGSPSDDDIALRFGTLNIALIVARIIRGLMLAGLLEQRLARGATRLDNPPAHRVRTTNPPPASAKRRARLKPPATLTDDKALLERLPTAEEIAARARNRSIGALIVDVCRDLGIAADHPLWHQLEDAVRDHGGNPARMLKDVIARAIVPRWRPPEDEDANAAIPPGTALAAATGPP